MTVINNRNRQEIIHQNQLKLQQRRHLRQEEFFRKEILRHHGVENLHDDEVIYDSILMGHDGLDGEADENGLESANFLQQSSSIFTPDLAAKLNSSINPSEILLLVEYYSEDSDLIRELDSICDSLTESEDGVEIKLLEDFLAKYVDSPQLVYLALFYILEELAKRKRKEEFRKQLSGMKKQFEAEESTYLLEFFDLLKCEKVKDKISALQLEQIAKLNSAQIQLTNLKDALEFVHKNLNNDFSNIVSLYMSIKMGQLKKITEGIANSEDSSKLFELVQVEKYLMVINSLCVNCNDFINKLQNFIYEGKTQLNVDLYSSLQGIMAFCESTYVSQVIVDKFIKSLHLADFATSKSLASQQYLRFLYEFAGLLRCLPLVLFQYNDSHSQKIIGGIQKLHQDFSSSIPSGASSKRNGLLGAKRAKPSLTRYV